MIKTKSSQGNFYGCKTRQLWKLNFVLDFNFKLDFECNIIFNFDFEFNVLPNFDIRLNF
jgi:hypothetical protein